TTRRSRRAPGTTSSRSTSWARAPEAAPRRRGPWISEGLAHHVFAALTTLCPSDARAWKRTCEPAGALRLFAHEPQAVFARGTHAPPLIEASTPASVPPLVVTSVSTHHALPRMFTNVAWNVPVGAGVGVGVVAQTPAGCVNQQLST